MMKLITIAFISLTAALTGTLNAQQIEKPTTTKEPNILKKDLQSVKPFKDTVTIIGVGDIMLGTDYPSSRYLHPSKSCNPVMKHVVPILKDADVTFGNMEGVLAGERGKAKHCNNPDQCYVFRMPVSYIDCIVDAGFDLISVANNHVNDFGYEGRRNTARVLSEAGLAFAGFKGSASTVKEIDGITYGLAAFAPHSGTADSRNIAQVKAVVSKLDSIADIVIVSFHAGAEGKKHQHVTRKTEMFLGYNRGNVYQFSHAAIDAGADVVFGHGPHVTRAVELYKDRLICYSLGNFATYRRFNLSGPNGIAPLMKVYTNKKGEFYQAQVIPIYQEGEGIPKVDPQKRVIAKLRDLTTIDFPEGVLKIEDDGMIYKK